MSSKSRFTFFRTHDRRAPLRLLRLLRLLRDETRLESSSSHLGPVRFRSRSSRASCVTIIRHSERICT